MIAAVDGRSRAASRLRLPFDKKKRKKEKKKKGHTGRLWLATTPDFVGACLVRLPTVPGLVADLGSHGSPKMSGPLLWVLSSFAGNLEVG